MAKMTADELHTFVDQLLLNGVPDAVWPTAPSFNRIVDVLKERQYEWTVLVEHWSLLIRTGVVAFAHGGRTDNPGQTSVVLTKAGRAYLERGDAMPHDPSTYIASIRKKVA